MLAINIDDVMNVLNTCKPYLIALAVVLLAAIIVTVAVRKLAAPKKKFIRSQSWIAFLLVVVIIVNMICFGPMSSMISLATGNGTITEETSAAATDLCEQIAEEGIVLLQNNDNTLPMASGTKLNVFGWSSTNPVYGGTGSGSLSDAYPTVSLLEGLENAGFEVNQDLVNFYTNFRATRPTVGMWGQDWTIPEPTVEDYDNAGIFESAKAYSDTAVVVLARSGGEGADLPTSLDPDAEDTFQDGGTFGSSGLRYSDQKDDLDASKSYLELSNREKAMLDRVTADYDNVVLVVNAANTMQLDFVEDYSQIKSVVWCPGTGQSGFNALGKILSGEVNPSAKTSDTFVRDLTKTPTYNNFGNFSYDNMDEFAVDGVNPTFVNYTDGIYVGYRFYETAATEGLINYDELVQYPFGYGLSYTTFEQKMGDLQVNDGQISVDVTITNTGDVAGKDVAEVYYNPPYTNGGIEKASANLVGFAKTQMLNPGESETVTVSFSAEDMASYDYQNAKAYVLESGSYEISLRTDSHTVVDTKTYDVAETITYNGDNARSTDVATAENKLDDANGGLTYLSRADGFANYEEATKAPTNFTMSDENKQAFKNNSNYNPEDYNDASDEMPTTGASNGMKLADLRGKDYDDPQWDSLLDQLTVSDMDTMIALGGYQTAAASSVGKVMTIDCDGPASINNNFTGTGSIGFPAGVMIANTWNTDIADQFGESIGKMADEMGVSGWYAPAMNIHRSAFAGRNFEYYSEDPFLSGAIAMNAVIGAEKQGVYAYIKHFALNDQETNRTNQLCTWFNEQSAREIYLKPFEMCVKNGGAKAVMTAFNFYGITPAEASSEVLNGILRDEWGFKGFALTDYYGVYGYQDADRMIRNGNDCMLVAYDTETNHVTDTTSATSVKAMRQACKNIMYVSVNSRAYDEANMQTGLMTWQIAAIVIDVICAAILIVLELLAVKKLKKRNAAAATEAKETAEA
ncbi:MAG: glycoside hydrolase family 3 N-terminal domain-containing protein [Lachnospiraceae bacterium]